jgi:lysylphosphatidylglycerol synthetase-like protein (DUF2156 family)
MTAKEIMGVIRGAIRPYLTFIFPTAVVVIGTMVVFKLLPIAVKFIDRDIALVIIVSILAIVTAIVTASTMIMSFMFGERAAKKPEEK